MGKHSTGGAELLLINLMDQVDVRTLSDTDRLRWIDAFDELISELNERALQLQASMAVAEWRAQVHDALRGASA